LSLVSSPYRRFEKVHVPEVVRAWLATLYPYSHYLHFNYKIFTN